MQQDKTALLALVEQAHQLQASDLILAAGSPTMIYRDGQMQAMGTKPLTAGELEQILLPALTDLQRERLTADRDIDFSIGTPDVGRFRINIHYQRHSVAAAIRFVPGSIPKVSDLNLPAIAEEFIRYPRGLVLITGGTSEGKSTTLAALVDQLNHQEPKHVITLEDPIEYAFRNDQCVIEQREIGEDSPSFAAALRHVVRQKPDVILVGELRDLETIATALTAAETGHLVLASLHTNSAPQTIERMVDVFDPRQQPQVRVQLANTLRAICCQVLLRNQRDGGMLPACEIMVNTSPIARAIRENNVHLIKGMIETGAQWGMQTLDSSIAAYVRNGRVSKEIALAKASNPTQLAKMLDHRPADAEPIGASASPSVSAGAGTSTKRKPWE